MEIAASLPRQRALTEHVVSITDHGSGCCEHHGSRFRMEALGGGMDVIRMESWEFVRLPLLLFL